jgi:hypothetical protein
MGGFYSLSRSNVALPASTDDFLTIIPAASRQFELIETSLGGMATTSAAGELAAGRSSGGTTPGGAVTAQPLREKQAAAGFTNATTWAAQPTLGPILLRIPVNANGGLYRWVRVPGMNILFVAGDTNPQLSFRPASGTPTVSFHALVEEF